MTEEEFIEIAIAKDRLKECNLAFREIDPDRNGYITNQELDDILRVNYGAEMEGKHMLKVVEQFASEANTILIDYNMFKKWVYSRIKEQTMSDSSSIEKTRLLA